MSAGRVEGGWAPQRALHFTGMGSGSHRVPRITQLQSLCLFFNEESSCSSCVFNSAFAVVCTAQPLPTSLGLISSSCVESMFAVKRRDRTEAACRSVPHTCSSPRCRRQPLITLCRRRAHTHPTHAPGRIPMAHPWTRCIRVTACALTSQPGVPCNRHASVAQAQAQPSLKGCQLRRGAPEAHACVGDPLCACAT